MLKKIIPTEAQECETLVDYLELRNLKFSHINNEMRTSSWGQKIKAKKQGVRKWVPDYIIIIKDKLIFIEMKKIKWSKVSTEQLEWNTELNKCWIGAYICFWFDDAKKVIDSYL